MQQAFTRAALAMLMAAAGLAACGQAQPAPQGPAKPASPAGKEARVVAFAPGIAETVFALGAGDRVIGVSSFCTYPPEVARVPQLGGMIDANLERLAALQPTLILLPGTHPSLEDFAQRQGVVTLDAYMDSLATLESGILRIGVALEKEPEAEALWRVLRRDLDAVAAAVAQQPRTRVLLVMTRERHNMNNLFSVGKSSFLSELLDLAGGENIFGDEAAPYLEVSKERILTRAPEVIIEVQSADFNRDEASAFLDEWEALPTVPAVRDGRVFLASDDYLLIPGPRVTLTARRFAGLLHPEATLPEPAP